MGDGTARVGNRSPLRERARFVINRTLAGAAVTVASAWALALIDVQRAVNWYIHEEDPAPRGVVHVAGVGVEQYHVYADAVSFRRSHSMAPEDGGLPGWAGWRGAPRGNWVEYTRASGWPFRALLSRAYQPIAPAPGAPLASRWGGLSLLPGDRFLFKGVLPLVPIPAGFLGDTILFAGLLAFATAARRRWRVRRGLCPTCAYRIGASPVCTECGRPLPAPRGG